MALQHQTKSQLSDMRGNRCREHQAVRRKHYIGWRCSPTDKQHDAESVDSLPVNVATIKEEAQTPGGDNNTEAEVRSMGASNLDDMDDAAQPPIQVHDAMDRSDNQPSFNCMPDDDACLDSSPAVIVASSDGEVPDTVW